MARRKKKTRPDKNVECIKNTQKAAKETQDYNSSEAPSQSANDSKTAIRQTGQKASGVNISTCVAGMFLTLVLGVYLGTLLPGIVKDIQSNRQPPVAVGAAETGAQGVAKPAQDDELKRMLGEMEKKAADNPGSAPDWINLGNIYFDSLMPRQAIAAYEHALEIAPKNPDVLTDLGIMYREAGEFAKALECFRKAIAINPAHENAMYNEGVVLAMDLKRNDEAREAWKKLLELNPRAHAPNGKPLAEMLEGLK